MQEKCLSFLLLLFALLYGGQTFAVLGLRSRVAPRYSSLGCNLCLSGMAPIDKRLFANGSEIAGEDLQLLEVRNFSEDVDTALKRFKWNGKLCGCIVLKLSADNAAVTSGQFLARGRLCRDEIKIEAAKIWPDAEPGLVLTLQLPDGAMFTFGEGGICSDYLGSDQVEHCVTATGRAARPIPPQEYNDAGIGAFCLRLVCHIGKATVKSGVVLNFNVLIFPGSPDAVGGILRASPQPQLAGPKIGGWRNGPRTLPTEPLGVPDPPPPTDRIPLGGRGDTPTVPAAKDSSGGHHGHERASGHLPVTEGAERQVAEILREPGRVLTEARSSLLAETNGATNNR